VTPSRRKHTEPTFPDDAHALAGSSIYETVKRSCDAAR